MSTSCFFEKQTDASNVKSRIVSKYFEAWANVILSQNVNKVVYLDLYSGPGRYDDGTPSTPVMVYDRAIQSPKIYNKLQMILNDQNKDFIDKLKNELIAMPDVNKLKYNPKFLNLKIDEKLVQVFYTLRKVPRLSFVDPWGYKGVSLPLIRSLVRGWGSDCIFFFNYRRLNPGVENDALKKPISLVFTKDVLNQLRTLVRGKSPEERERIILKKVEDVFKEWGMNYVLSFPFKTKTGKRTTHHLIFVSKNVLGYNIMKGIMGTESSCTVQDVPSFQYNPAQVQVQQPLFNGPMDQLKDMLLSDFSGKTLSMQEVFNIHNIGKPYLEKNYRKALLDLEEEKKITTDREKRKPRKGTFPKTMMISFPS